VPAFAAPVQAVPAHAAPLLAPGARGLYVGTWAERGGCARACHACHACPSQGLQVREVEMARALQHLELEHLSSTKEVDLRQWLGQQREAAARKAAGTGRGHGGQPAEGTAAVDRVSK
jgi:hypothetical protein